MLAARDDFTGDVSGVVVFTSFSCGGLSLTYTNQIHADYELRLYVPHDTK